MSVFGERRERGGGKRGVRGDKKDRLGRLRYPCWPEGKRGRWDVALGLVHFGNCTFHSEREAHADVTRAGRGIATATNHTLQKQEEPVCATEHAPVDLYCLWYRACEALGLDHGGHCQTRSL